MELGRIDNGTNLQIRQELIKAFPAAKKQAAAIAERFKGRDVIETARNVHDLLRSFTYKPDTTNQKIQLPSALFRSRVGDCKSYSLTAVAILSALDYPVAFVFSTDKGYDHPNHVYAMTWDKYRRPVPVDGVLKKPFSQPKGSRKDPVYLTG